MAKREKMDEKQVRAIVEREATDAVGWYDSEVGGQQIENMNYYLGEPFGNERDGRSKIVLTELADTIELIMPQLIRMFCGTEQTVKFEPREPEDVAPAEQATDYVNHIIHVDNPGFTILHNFLKDGLLSKFGIVKAWWDESEDVSEEEYKGLTLEQLAILTAEEGVEIIAQSQDEMEPSPEADMMGQMGMMAQPAEPTFSVRIKKTTKSGKACIEGIPGEEFLISKRAKSLHDAAFCAHRVEKMVSDLVAEGHSYEELIQHVGTMDDQNAQKDVRFKDVDADGENGDSADMAMRPIVVTEAYIRIDQDGDGIAELRRIKCVGTGYHILENEVFDVRPFAMWSSIMMPHRAIGRCLADLLKDIQLIKSTIFRNTLDNLYLVNNQRPVVGPGVNLDDLLQSAPGYPIRSDNGPGALMWQQVPAVAQHAFPILEYLDRIKSQRTGINETSAGLNADALQNTTATAVAAQLSAAQGKIELIARIFAETGLKDLMRLILRLVTKYQQKARMVRLRNEFVPIDPRAWKNEYDMVVSVGLGTGQISERLNFLSLILQKQELLLKTLGRDNVVVTPQKYVGTLHRMVETAGYRDVEAFFGMPQEGQPLAPPAPPQPDPAMIKVQGQLEAQKVKQEGDMALKQQEMQMEARQAEAELSLETRLRLEELDREFMLRRQEMMMQAAVGVHKNRVSTNLPRAN